MWLLLVGTLLPGYAVVVLMAALDAIDAIAPRLQVVADGLETATFRAAFIAALSACMLVPKRPSWRLLNLDDTAALKLRKYAWGAAALAWLSTVLVALDQATRTSDVTTVALDGLIALTYLGLIMAMLVTLARLHRRQNRRGRSQAGGAGRRPRGKYAGAAQQLAGAGAGGGQHRGGGGHRRDPAGLPESCQVREPAADRRQHRGAGRDPAVQVRR